MRLRILAGGCSGLEYKLDLLEAGEEPRAGDRRIDSNGVTMLMDLIRQQREGATGEVPHRLLKYELIRRHSDAPPKRRPRVRMPARRG